MPSAVPVVVVLPPVSTEEEVHSTIPTPSAVPVVVVLPPVSTEEEVHSTIPTPSAVPAVVAREMRVDEDRHPL
jgi:hypothetical protein